MDNQPIVRHVSDTALWTAFYRAEESDRSDALFRDPFARALAGERGRAIARKAHPAVRHGVVMRTAVLDRVIMAAVRDGVGAVLNLAAGLDTRPYRLDLPASLVWFEVDMPELLEYKESVIGDAAPRCALERVRLDLSRREERRALFARVASAADRVLVVTEGLLSYLAPESVAELAADLHEWTQFERWATDLTRGMVLRGVRNASDTVSDGRLPSLFAPDEGAAFFLPLGWEEADFHNLFFEAQRLGRGSLLGTLINFAMRFAPAEKREAFERGIGIVELKRI